tara:strand:- start:9867 stop:10442 length:576 start_codon:yes stop_codon:yes gene_type:complete
MFANVLKINRKIKLNNLANLLTIIRSIIGILALLFLTKEVFLIAWLLILFGGISDTLDGWLARKSTEGASKWGARMDPLADKLMLLAPILWLSSKGILPLWSVWVLFARELIISSWRANQQSGAPASVQGKLKTIFQFIAILLMLWPEYIFKPSIYLMLTKTGLVLYWVALLLAITSFFDYFKHHITYRQH